MENNSGKQYNLNEPVINPTPLIIGQIAPNLAQTKYTERNYKIAWEKSPCVVSIFRLLWAS